MEALDTISVSSEVSQEDEYFSKVMNVCQQTCPTHFALQFPSNAYTDFEYVDSGTYSHVVRATSKQWKKVVVFKVSRGRSMPVPFA